MYQFRSSLLEAKLSPFCDCGTRAMTHSPLLLCCHSLFNFDSVQASVKELGLM